MQLVDLEFQLDDDQTIKDFTKNFISKCNPKSKHADLKR